MSEDVRDVGQGKGPVIKEYMPEEVQDIIKILGNDYSTASLLQEFDQRLAQLVASCGQVAILEQYARQLAKDLQNQGVTVKALLDNNCPLTLENMRHISERAVLQSTQADIVANHVESLANILAGNLRDMGRMMETAKALIRDYPQPPEKTN